MLSYGFAFYETTSIDYCVSTTDDDHDCRLTIVTMEGRSGTYERPFSSLTLDHLNGW